MTHRLRLSAPVERWERRSDAAFWLFAACMLAAVVGLAWWFVVVAPGLMR